MYSTRLRFDVCPRPKVLLCVIFLTNMCCPRLCSHVGWLLLKCSAIGIGFNGAETNCGIARILGILLMNSWDTYIYFLATTIICSLSTLNWTQWRNESCRSYPLPFQIKRESVYYGGFRFSPLSMRPFLNCFGQTGLTLCKIIKR